MALTDTQKASIRRYLGYPDWRQGAYSLLEGRMSVLSDEGEIEVEGLLTDIGTIETRIKAIYSLQHVTRAEEVELRGPEGVASLRMEGRRLVEQLAAMLGVPIERNAFATGGGSFGQAGRG